MPKQILLIWAIMCSSVILYFCLTDSGNLPDVGDKIPNLDKIVHFCFHLGLTFSWILFFRKDLKNKTTDNYKAYFISFALSVFLGITIEVLQNEITVTRAAEVFDILANSLGSLTAVLIAVGLEKQIDNV